MTPPCKARHINHVCIAVNDIEDTLAFYRDVFGTPEVEVEEIEDQGVRAALVRVGGSQLEFIQPTDPSGGVARFIERRGEGVHHIAFEVDDLQGRLDDLAERAVQLIDTAPERGAVWHDWVHPSARYQGRADRAGGPGYGAEVVGWAANILFAY